MQTDPFEPLITFRPGIAGKRSEADSHRGPVLAGDIRRRLQRMPRPRRGGTRAAARNAGVVAEPNALSRRCLVKAHFVPVHAGHRDAARLHLTYLERDGVERDGSAGVLYGAEDPFDRAAFSQDLPGERRQFRFIVSPEDADDLDLHAFTRHLMSRMSGDLRRPFLWAAVNHHNTEHPHVHIVIRGLVADGRDLRIPSGYIKQARRRRGRSRRSRADNIGSTKQEI